MGDTEAMRQALADAILSLRSVQPMTDHVYELPTDRCACGHTRMVHEPHCVVTYYAPKRACPDNCREFVHDPEATDD